MKLLFVFIQLGLLWCSGVLAQTLSPEFNYEGRLFDKVTGLPLTSSIDIQFQIWDHTGNNCKLYEEVQTGISLDSATDANDGFFNLAVGTPVGSARRTADDPGLEMTAVFSNSSSLAGNSCSYSPTAGDSRKMKVLIKSAGAPDGNYELLSPDHLITSVPNALVAESLQGSTPSDFIKVHSGSGLTQANVQGLTTHTTALVDLASGTSNLYLKAGDISYSSGNLNFTSGSGDILLRDTPLTGDSAVNKDYTDTRVAGRTLALGLNLSEGQTLVWDATNQHWKAASATVNTGTGANQIVQRDASGNIEMATHDLINTGYITMTSDRYIQISKRNTTSETTLTAGLNSTHEGALWYNETLNQLSFWDGSSLQRLPTESSLGSMADQSAIDYLLRDGSLSMTGALDMAGELISNLATPVASSDASTKGYVDAAFAAISTSADGSYLSIANNLSDLNNITTARVNLGLGSMAIEDAGDFLRLDGTSMMDAELDMNGFQILNVSTPVSTTDAANKSYVDTNINTLSNDLMSNYIRKDGSSPLVADWNVGNRAITSVSSLEAGGVTLTAGKITMPADNILIGSGSDPGAYISSIAIGRETTALGSNAIALGNNAEAGSSALALGRNASATGSGATAIGFGVTNPYSDSVAIGSGSTTHLLINASGNVGIGTSSPTSRLAVMGVGSFSEGVNPGTGSQVCTAANEGLLRYNSTEQYMEFCDGSLWKPVNAKRPGEVLNTVFYEAPLTQFTCSSPTGCTSSSQFSYTYTPRSTPSHIIIQAVFTTQLKRTSGGIIEGWIGLNVDGTPSMLSFLSFEDSAFDPTGGGVMPLHVQQKVSNTTGTAINIKSYLRTNNADTILGINFSRPSTMVITEVKD